MKNATRVESSHHFPQRDSIRVTTNRDLSRVEPLTRVTLSLLFADLSSTTHIRLCSAIAHFCLKQLSLSCLLRLFSASADLIGYITMVCSMIGLLHELKTAIVNTEPFRHLIMSQQGKRKTKRLLCFYT